MHKSMATKWRHFFSTYTSTLIHQLYSSKSKVAMTKLIFTATPICLSLLKQSIWPRLS